MSVWHGFFACSVCFGDPASEMSKGARAGVLFMLIVVIFVLSAIASIAMIWAKRAKKISC